jgi:hypothetical protein
VSYGTKQTLQRFADALFIVDNRNHQTRSGSWLHRWVIVKLMWGHRLLSFGAILLSFSVIAKVLAEAYRLNHKTAAPAYAVDPFSVLTVNRTVAPRSLLLLTNSRPPCDSMMDRQITSPNPNPSGFVV